MSDDRSDEQKTKEFLSSYLNNYLSNLAEDDPEKLNEVLWLGEKYTTPPKS